jgi:hypothetical protein
VSANNVCTSCHPDESRDPVSFLQTKFAIWKLYILASEKKSFLLRIDPQLWAALEKLAAAELRSVNSQIEYLLREAAVKRGMKLGADEVAAEYVPTTKARKK